MDENDGNLVSKLRFAYRYIFFRIYSWQLKQFGPVNAPEMVGVAGVGWLIWFNILSLLILLRFLTGIDFFAAHASWIAGGLIFLIFVCSLYSFMFQKKYYLIAKEFENENEIDRRRRGIYVWTYTLASTILLVASILTSDKKPLL